MDPVEPSARAGSGGGCATHPDRPAEGTCTRCGDHLCAECVRAAEDGLCARCVERLSTRGKLAQIDWLAVTTMLHGGLMVGYGLVMTLAGGIFATSVSSGLPPEADPEVARVMVGMVAAIPILMTIVHVAAGGLQLAAGYFMRLYRFRALAIAAYVAAGVTVVGCYCLPSSILLAIWGFVVLFDRDVAARFASTARAREAARGAAD